MEVAITGTKRRDVIYAFALHRKFPAARHDAENGMDAAANVDFPTDYFRIAGKTVLPKLIPKNDDARRARFVLFTIETATKHRLRFENIENICCRRHSCDIGRIVPLAENHAGAGIGRHAGKGVVLDRADPRNRDTNELRARYPAVAAPKPRPRPVVPDAEMEWPQQDGVDHAEDGAVGSNPKRKSDDGDDTESRGLDQHSKRIAKVI